MSWSIDFFFLFLLSDCKDNKGIFTALQVDNLFNLNEFLNISMVRIIILLKWCVYVLARVGFTGHTMIRMCSYLCSLQYLCILLNYYDMWSSTLQGPLNHWHKSLPWKSLQSDTPPSTNLGRCQ